uniref:tRNA (guanosine(18)-2'-O)-methyltransferase TARBP1 n=1 Tax=Cannabis sativa TaxID=3483 RepID=A0A803PMX3_CANSA
MAINDNIATVSLINSLCNSFRQVPPASVPAVLDCVLASTGLSPSSLFAALIDNSPDIDKDEENGDNLDSDQCNYLASFVSALCHLLKKLGSDHNALKEFIWRSFLPLVNALHSFNRELLNQVVETFVYIVVETNSWMVVQADLVPFLLRSLYHSLHILQNEELENMEWDLFPSYVLSCLGLDKERIWHPNRSIPPPISCYILSVMLDAALSNQQTAVTSELGVANECVDALHFAGNLIWSLCSMAEHMLSQSLEHRACTISFLLPIVSKAFASYHSFEVVIQGKKLLFSRNDFFVKIWKCCRTLFSLGPIERRDAYSVLSLYLSFLPCTDKWEDGDIRSDKVEVLDIRAEEDFWNEIKRGLVDKESFVRKQSLHMLKKAVGMNNSSQSSSVSEITSHNKQSAPQGMTKRELWAEMEAQSLGLGRIHNSVEPDLNSQQKWEAFVLLYEMLEEYGTHLVEAAWNHQVSLLLQSSTSHVDFASTNGGKNENHLEISGEICKWLAILWERGLQHDNPQVRCLIMQSILSIKWRDNGNSANSVPETFILGSFLQALNDPVHHKEFGVKGVYSSKTMEGAAEFLSQYASCLSSRKWIVFLINLASATKQQSFSRAGLMGLAECIAAVASRVTHDNESEAERDDMFAEMAHLECNSESFLQNDKIVLLNALRFTIESSKQHFNPNYRLRVCEKVLEAGASVVCTFDVPLEILLHFISTVPRDFTDYGGSLRVKVQEWLMGCRRKHCRVNCSSTEFKFLKSLHDFPSRFTSPHYKNNSFSTYGDEDLDAWESEAKRWARVLFLAIKEECHLMPIWMFIQNHGTNICSQNENLEYLPIKFLILTLSLVLELQIMQDRTTEFGIKFRTRAEFFSSETINKLGYAESAALYKKFTNVFHSIMEELVSYATLSSSIFSSSIKMESNIPSSVKGKLGGPSQRRLSSSTTTVVLQAITSMKTVALVSSWCAQFESDYPLDFAFKFLWSFFQSTISSPACDSETGAEICLAAYEALTFALRALVSVFSTQTLDFIRENDKLLSKLDGKAMLDFLVLSFLENINDLIGVGVLVRTRRAVLMNWKWLCLESLLSIPGYAIKHGLNIEDIKPLFSDAALRQIFNDIVENLENAGEGSVLPILRSVRLALGLLAEGKSGPLVSSCNGIEAQMIWNLVRSSWILHVSCNKRKVAPIAALLSSVLHAALFTDESMHMSENASGPLKWFIEKILEEGTKSPRTIRLAALHLSGMWLLNPEFIKYYMKELKLLSLYGSVAFDEDFEAEIADNHDTRIELSLLAKSPDSELTEAFINTELYARVSVAVLFSKLADSAEMVGLGKENEDGLAALESGKLFLLELLDAAVNDNDLSKELYKKYSAIHRRKIRAWQMICVLSRFVCQDIVGQVTNYLHISLTRNNLPAVRQYLETFAINVYLKFPLLVEEQIVPVLRNYDMRPQALSSYIFIAANVIIHASEAVQSKHLDILLPPIVPLLTSHHHSLRGFTQLLVYQVLFKFFPPADLKATVTMSLEKRCFEDLKTYLAKNSDCTRLRASMEGYLDAYNPTVSVMPAGIFINRVEELEFECVPKSLMEEVLAFLNDVREDLRSSMAKDLVTIKNESLRSGKDQNCVDLSANDSQQNSIISQHKDALLDFQKKITLSKHEKQDNDINSLLGHKESYRQLAEIEKEDQLLDHLLQSTSLAMEQVRTSRQQCILVASLIDRIPNLAGLARTCEVFKALGLAVADASILNDKQFQLISVTADKWVPIIEVPVDSMKVFLEKKKREGYSILGLEQTANSIQLDHYTFPKKMVLVLGREKEGIPVDIIHILDACIEIPQLGVVRSLNVHVSGAIALWEYTRQQRS